jgi:phosphatidate cytidylyltransferase
VVWTRIASGVVLAPLFLALVYFGYPSFHIMVGVIAALMAWEFIRMDSRLGKNQRTLLLAAGFVGAVLIPLAAPWAMIIVALSMIGLVIKRGDPVYLAPSYAILPAITLAFIWAAGGGHGSGVATSAGFRVGGGSFSIFWVLAIVWATDIGAYAFGRMIGGPKLAPSISPNKTRSGAVGGLICAVVVSAALLWVFKVPLGFAHIGVAILISIISQTGDLFESAIKRLYGVKDSGSLIPGHGGFMDRFDGLWAAAPVAAVFCVIFGGGVQQW